MERQEEVQTLSAIAEELLLAIFRYLDFKDLHQCSLVSSQWRRIANDNTLWEVLFQKFFPEEYGFQRLENRIWKWTFFEEKLNRKLDFRISDAAKKVCEETSFHFVLIRTKFLTSHPKNIKPPKKRKIQSEMFIPFLEQYVKMRTGKTVNIYNISREEAVNALTVIAHSRKQSLHNLRLAVCENMAEKFMMKFQNEEWIKYYSSSPILHGKLFLLAVINPTRAGIFFRVNLQKYGW